MIPPPGRPEPLTAHHDLSDFDCGDDSLNHWLRARALKNQKLDASRTYVITTGGQVTGYYALSAGSVTQAGVPSSLRRNMPEPVPVMLLGRLAVGQAWQGRGIGRALLRDALRRTTQAADIAGIKAIMVHAIDDTARRWYLDSGFRESPSDPMLLFVSLREIRQIIQP